MGYLATGFALGQNLKRECQVDVVRVQCRTLKDDEEGWVTVSGGLIERLDLVLEITLGGKMALEPTSYFFPLVCLKGNCCKYPPTN